jgi:preprotein translocase subunit SecG
METLLTAAHIVLTLVLILLVLLQSGKGAEVSASFSGGSNTLFGSSGGSNFFTKLTGVVAGLFMLTSLLLAVVKSQGTESVLERVDLTKTAPVSAPKAADSAPAGEKAQENKE